MQDGVYRARHGSAGRAGRQAAAPSSKQGPSKRKVRRWNNDNFVGVASDLASSSARGAVTARLILDAKANSGRYEDLYQKEYYPSTFTRFKEESSKVVRDSFIRGEIGNTVFPFRTDRHKRSLEHVFTDGGRMLDQVHERLRNVVVRASANPSSFAVKLMNSFEKYLEGVFSKRNSDLSIHPAMEEVLSQPPHILKRSSDSSSVRFVFDSGKSGGGFHRILLHSVCQFHGLKATSANTLKNNSSAERSLTVSGQFRGAKFHITDVAKSTACRD